MSLSSARESDARLLLGGIFRVVQSSLLWNGGEGVTLVLTVFRDVTAKLCSRFFYEGNDHFIVM